MYAADLKARLVYIETNLIIQLSFFEHAPEEFLAGGGGGNVCPMKED